MKKIHNKIIFPLDIFYTVSKINFCSSKFENTCDFLTKKKKQIEIEKMNRYPPQLNYVVIIVLYSSQLSVKFQPLVDLSHNNQGGEEIK